MKEHEIYHGWHDASPNGCQPQTIVRHDAISASVFTFPRDEEMGQRWWGSVDGLKQWHWASDGATLASVQRWCLEHASSWRVPARPDPATNHYDYEWVPVEARFQSGLVIYQDAQHWRDGWKGRQRHYTKLPRLWQISHLRTGVTVARLAQQKNIKSAIEQVLSALLDLCPDWHEHTLATLGDWDFAEPMFLALEPLHHLLEDGTLFKLNYALARALRGFNRRVEEQLTAYEARQAQRAA